jgi:hypothetical protein
LRDSVNAFDACCAQVTCRVALGIGLSALVDFDPSERDDREQQKERERRDEWSAHKSPHVARGADGKRHARWVFPETARVGAIFRAKDEHALAAM